MVSNGVPAQDPQRTSIDPSGHVPSDPRVRRRLRHPREVPKVRNLIMQAGCEDPSLYPPQPEGWEEDPSLYHMTYDKLGNDIRRRITGGHWWH